jgi:hypothetical protein
MRNQRGSSSLPPDWKALVDEASGKSYYWNTKTNETKWEMPTATAAASSQPYEEELPPGWVEVVHSATRQTYFVHQGTGEKRWTRPVHTADRTDIPDPLAKKKAATAAAASSRARPQETEAQRQEKRRRLTVDPLDPTGGMVGTAV